MEKFGVSLDDDLAARVERRRVREDAESGHEIVSRSQVVRDLVSLGLAAESVMERAEGLDLGRGHPREAFVRQALLNELEREGLGPTE
jgi:metal-responsive CopG/Arc/MetJ family transcriptional regulator